MQRSRAVQHLRAVVARVADHGIARRRQHGVGLGLPNAASASERHGSFRTV